MRRFVEGLMAQETPAMVKLVDAMAGQIPALLELEGTPQDSQWHAEGNVLIHTGMVLEETYRLLAELPEVTGVRRAALILGAALHDIAKPDTTREREIDGQLRVVAPRHEREGRSYLAPLLVGQGLPYSLVELTLGLVGYHIEPKFLVVKDRARGSYLRLSRCADPELLYWLELADMRGRRCSDQVKQVEHIEMFALLAQDLRAWQRFGNDSASWRARVRTDLAGASPETRDVVYGELLAELEEERSATIEEALAKSYGYREGFGELVIMVGPSGAGKTTWVERHLNDHELISLDDIREELGGRQNQSNNGRVLQLAKTRLKRALSRKARVVWDATNLRRDFRQTLADLGRDYHALVTQVCFHRSATDYARGNASRAHAVPRQVLQRQLRSMQWPELWEAHRSLFIGDGDEVLACYGRLDTSLPYGLEASPETLRDESS